MSRNASTSPRIGGARRSSATLAKKRAAPTGARVHGTKSIRVARKPPIRGRVDLTTTAKRQVAELLAGAKRSIMADVMEEIGELIYAELAKPLEAAHSGKVVAIEVKSGDWHVGDSELDAWTLAAASHPGELFYFRWIGAQRLTARW